MDMAYADKVRDLGNHVKFAPNTKGTGTRGNPMPDIGKTELAMPIENPSKGAVKTVGKNVKGLRDLGKRKKISTKI
jgi:hypothetical protein